MAAVLKYFSPAAKPFHASKKRYGREEAQARAAYSSTAVYVGNLAFVTTDSQIHALFTRCGPIDRIVMGLNKVTRMPCGFAFVIFTTRAAAVDAVVNLHGTVLDERVIKVEMDKGFYEGRQYGRGESGGQVRDELRAGYDEGRGGYGAAREAAALVAAAAAIAGGGYYGSNSGDGDGNGGIFDGYGGDADPGAAVRRFSSNLLPPGASLLRSSSGGDDGAALSRYTGRCGSAAFQFGASPPWSAGGSGGRRDSMAGGGHRSGQRWPQAHGGGGKRRRTGDAGESSGADVALAADGEGGEHARYGAYDGVDGGLVRDEAALEDERARRRSAIEDVDEGVDGSRRSGGGGGLRVTVDEFGREVRAAGDDENVDGEHADPTVTARQTTGGGTGRKRQRM